MEAYEAYKIYHALKLHFNSDYDYTKYNGKAKVTVDSYLKRKDRTFLYLTLLLIQKAGLVILMKKIIQNIVKEIRV